MHHIQNHMLAALTFLWIDIIAFALVAILLFPGPFRHWILPKPSKS